MTRHQLDGEIKTGHLVALAPPTYARPWDHDSLPHQELAAVKSAGPATALSHLSALRRRQLPVPVPSVIHISTPVRQYIRPRAGIVVHRTVAPIVATMAGNAPTTVAAHAIIESWPLLHGSAQRAPAISAVAQRACTVEQLSAAVHRRNGLPGRVALLGLLALIESGCRSELELWGHSHVFDAAGIRPDVRQRAIVVQGRSYYLDMAYEQQRVCVELDGRAYHSSAAQWERDIARDLALATIGWQTIRFSHRRLTTDVDGCRRDIGAVLTQRAGSGH